MGQNSTPRPVPPKIKFSLKEDNLLRELVEQHGTKNWILISDLIESRTPRQCRERWINYLSPNLKSDGWTSEEDKLIDELYQKYGSRWHKIAKHFKNRSGNCIRNRYKLRMRHLRKISEDQKVEDEEIENKMEKPEYSSIFQFFTQSESQIDLFPLSKDEMSEIRAILMI